MQDEAGHLKVTDFGLSKNAHEKDAHGYKMTGGTGTCMTSHLTEDWTFWQLLKNILIKLFSSDRYMAPEVYRRESYGKSVDVFSFALIVHEVSCKFQ